MAKKRKKVIELHNVDVLLLNLSLINTGALRRGAKRAVTRAAMHLERKLKEKLSQPGSGKIYQGKGRRHSHQASAPGEPPAPDDGELRRSVTHNVTGNKPKTLPNPGGILENPKANVGTPLARGFALEVGFHGYPYGNKKLPLVYVAPRPWFYNTIEEEKGEVRAIIRRTLKEALVTAKLKKSKRRR